MRGFRPGLAIICVLASLSAGTGPIRAVSQEDRVITVPDDDAEMNAAIAKARATLPQFWAAFDAKSKDTDLFSLKVPIRNGVYTEHFWLGDIERTGGKIFGVIGNDPEHAKSVRYGQRIEVHEEDISDWMFMRKGKIVGNYTLRALLKRMPADEAEYWKALLENP